jgi:hypothetical protein
MANHGLNCFSARPGRAPGRSGFAAAVLLLAAGLAATQGLAEGADMRVVVVGPGGRGFVESGRDGAYIPFGTNYYDPETGWAPKIWRRFDAERVRLHFDAMSSLGVNCARVFLTAGSFQPDAQTVEEGALEKLDVLVGIARERGIRLILTGPDHWEGRAEYWSPDRYGGEAALEALEHFWDVVGRRYRGEPAIFAWDLLNEPHMPWFVEQWRPKWSQWLRRTYGDWESLKSAWGDEPAKTDRWGAVGVPADRSEAENPRLRDWQLFREYLADEWVRRQVEAIRRADPTHLITVGYIQWSYPLVRPGNPSRYSAFNPRRQEQWLDFVTIHFYPTMGGPFVSKENWEKNLDYLRAVLAYCHTGKPVVLGEYGWYGGGAPQEHPFLSEVQQLGWLSAEIEASRELASGWLSWPFADSPESTDISLFGGLVKSDLRVKAWGRRFGKYAANPPRRRREGYNLPRIDVGGALTFGQKELEQLHGRYVSGIRQVVGPVDLKKAQLETDEAALE